MQILTDAEVNTTRCSVLVFGYFRKGYFKAVLVAFSWSEQLYLLVAQSSKF
jgi:hypothetical protein